MNRLRFLTGPGLLPLICLAITLSGCTAAGTAAMEGASGLAGTIGTGVSGFETAGTQKRVSEAQVQLTLANAELLRNQAADLAYKRIQIERQRSAVAYIFRREATSEHDPFLDDVALWVDAGGDPDYAFHYLMTREQSHSRQEHSTLVVPSNPQHTAPHPSHQSGSGSQRQTAAIASAFDTGTELNDCHCTIARNSDLEPLAP